MGNATHTKAKILGKALELFNQSGIEQVGVREIARELNLSPGNLSYHFPSKEFLITALFERFEESLSQQISANHLKDRTNNLADFINEIEKVLKQQDDYRFLFISFQSVMEISLLKQKTIIIQQKRKDQLILRLTNLKEHSKIFLKLGPKQLEQLANNILMMIRFRYLDAYLEEPALSTVQLTEKTLVDIREFLILHAKQ